jgi:hypothetical protein
MDDDLAALCDDYWALRCATFPFQASLLGYRAFDERVPDLSRAGQAALAPRPPAVAQPPRAGSASVTPPEASWTGWRRWLMLATGAPPAGISPA